MGGIVGRLSREFTVVVCGAVLLSTIVSLTLTPMLCARFLRHRSDHGLLHRLVERGFEAMVAFYARTLDVALRFGWRRAWCSWAAWGSPQRNSTITQVIARLHERFAGLRAVSDRDGVKASSVS